MNSRFKMSAIVRTIQTPTTQRLCMGFFLDECFRCFSFDYFIETIVEDFNQSQKVAINMKHVLKNTNLVF